VEEHLKDATVVAPFDGVIVVKNVDHKPDNTGTKHGKKQNNRQG
jgi:hypothetical protein